MDDVRLTIELVPSTSWYSNLRKAVKPPVWDRLRKQVYAQCGNRCSVCGSEYRLACHEVWDYDDVNHVQRLTGFTALCMWCHHVKHLGLAGILASEGKLDYGKVIAHYMEVNACSRLAFSGHKRAAFQQWNERSEHEWRVDLGKYGKTLGLDMVNGQLSL